MVAADLFLSRKVRAALGRVPDNIRWGRPRESATENRPPQHAVVRVKRCGKSAPPDLVTDRGTVNPTRSKAK